MSTWERKLEAVDAVYKDRKYNRALFLLDETLKTHTDIPIYATKCDILIQLNRVEEAIDVAKDMAVANELSPEGYKKGAYICKSLKKYQPALSIVDHISWYTYVSEPSVHIDKFLGAFDNLKELEVLKLERVVFAPAVLETISKNKLCPKLRKVEVAGSTDAIDEHIVQLIEQRNCTNEIASIDELCLRSCSYLQAETIEFVRQHVKAFKCNPF